MSLIKKLLISLISLYPMALYGATAGADGVVSESIQAPFYGLNTADPSFRIDPKFSPYMRNVFIDDGKIEGIRGFTVMGSSNTLQKVTGIFPYKRETGQKTFLVTDSSITLETSDFKNWTFVSSGSNTGSTLNWMQVRDKMWGFNGVDNVMTWNGTNKVILDGDPASVPNVPKFKYGAYWHDRVWGFNIPGFASDVYYSALSSTDAVIIAPDDYRAWPANQFLKVNSGDGQFGTAMWVSNSQLQIGKELSLYTVYGTGPSSYFVRQNESDSIGVVSNDSVVNFDNATYFLSRDGIYRNTERISDNIEPDVENIVKTNVNVVSSLWETKADFEKGQFFGTTATVSGLVQMPLSPHTAVLTDNPRLSFAGFPVPPSGDDPATFPKTLNAGSTYYGPIRLSFYEPGGSGVFEIKNSERLYLRKLPSYSTILEGGGASCANITLKVFNSFTGESQTVTHPDPKNFIDIDFPLQEPVFDGYTINMSSFHFKIEYTNTGSCSNDVTVNNFAGDIFQFQPATTGQYLSEVVTNTVVSAWGNFDSIRNTNGGTINYYKKTSTSSVNITTQPWVQIVPGAIMPDPLINNYVQWAATITSVSSFTNVSNIDNVSIDHIEGGSAYDRAFGISWKNRYWLATTTATNSGKTLIYVKSKITNENPNAWMPIEGIDIYCFAKDDDYLYAGSISTNTVLRLDYGTNFNGTAIRYVYDVPDLILGDNYRSKSILSYLLDAQKYTSLAFSIGSSIDGGDYSYRSVPFSGSGRGTMNIKGVVAPAKTLRVRLTHSLLDTPFIVNDLTIRAKILDVLEPK